MVHLALLPILETLPGWPESTDPALIDTLAVTLLWPAAIAAVFALAIMGPKWFRTAQAPSAEVELNR